MLSGAGKVLVSVLDFVTEGWVSSSSSVRRWYAMLNLVISVWSDFSSAGASIASSICVPSSTCMRIGISSLIILVLSAFRSSGSCGSRGLVGEEVSVECKEMKEGEYGKESKNNDVKPLR